MTFDKPEHREIALQLLQNMNFPGAALEAVYEFKQAVLRAEVPKPEPSETPSN